MHREKVITVVAASGILACGACFLPPPRPARSPGPPRPGIDLRGSYRIRVTATDSSPAGHLDTGMLERCVADSINRRSPPGLPQAAGGDAKPRDAVLSITIEKEDAKPEAEQLSSNSTAWDFDVTLSAALRGPDGTVVWEQNGKTYLGVVNSAKGAEPWTSGAIAARARYSICDSLAAQLLSSGR